MGRESYGYLAYTYVCYRLLTRVQQDVELQLRRKPLARFFLQGSITEMLEDRTHQIETAWRAFDVRVVSMRCCRGAHYETFQTACLISLRMKAVSQSVYDDSTQV